MAEAMTAAEALLGQMRASGIDYLFANSGTDFPPIIEAYATASPNGPAYPEPLVVPHETVAVGMAHGAYLVTGRPQAVMVHVNVGLANTTMGVINAATDNVPMLLCAGRTPVTESGFLGSRSIPIHWGQEMRDQTALVREGSKWDYELRVPDQAASLVARAVAVATSEPQGPVFLGLPREALSEPMRNAPAEPPRLAPALPGLPSAKALAEAAGLLAGAKSPLVIVQRSSGDEAFRGLSRFAEELAVPVVEFWTTRNALSTEHPMHAGRDPARWLADADLVLVIEALVPWVPGQVRPAPGAKVVGIGSDPLFSRTPVREFAVDVALPGSTPEILAALLERVAGQRARMNEAIAARRQRMAAFRERSEAEIRRKAEAGCASPMSPLWIAHCLSRAMPPGTRVFSELALDPAAIRATEPSSFFSHPLSGGLGWGLPAALGAQLADRERQVVACVGDGSYLFANPMACHQLAATHGLPLLTIVFNNGIWNAVKRATTAMYPNGRAVAMETMPLTSLGPSPDYPAIARAYGAHAEKVEHGEALPAALERAFRVTREEMRQVLLEVIVPA